MENKLLITKRKKARHLYFVKNWSIRKISKSLVAGRNNVSRWVTLNEADVTTDGRGWKKNKLRKYTQKDKETIISLRHELIKEESYFWGDKVIQSNYENQGNGEVSLWFINSVLREKGLALKQEKKKKGVSKYMMYPVKAISKMGKSMMSLDFIGPKYLEGSPDKINFLSCKYIRPGKVGIVKRITGQTTEQTIETLKEIWEKHYIPDVLKVDNDSAFGANLTHEKCIGRLTLLLLNLGVKPLYIAPRCPWNNGEVEGFNNVFSKKFWNRISFENTTEIDIKIKTFNFEYEKYTNLVFNNSELKESRKMSDFKDVDLANKKIESFREKNIYFLRIVRRKGDKGGRNEKGFINILGHELTIKKDLINLFVFCRLSLSLEKIIISTEVNGILKVVSRKKYIVRNLIY